MLRKEEWIPGLFFFFFLSDIIIKEDRYNSEILVSSQYIFSPCFTSCNFILPLYRDSDLEIRALTKTPK